MFRKGIGSSDGLRNNYKLMKNELRLNELLSQSEDDLRNGRVVPIDGMFDRIRDKAKGINLNK